MRMRDSEIRSVRSQYGKDNGIGEMVWPTLESRTARNRTEQNRTDPSQTLGPIWMPLQIYHYVHPGNRYAEFD